MLNSKKLAEIYELDCKLGSVIGKIRQIALNEDEIIMKLTDKLYAISRKLNDYIYGKLP